MVALGMEGWGRVCGERRGFSHQAKVRGEVRRREARRRAGARRAWWVGERVGKLEGEKSGWIGLRRGDGEEGRELFSEMERGVGKLMMAWSVVGDVGASTVSMEIGVSESAAFSRSSMSRRLRKSSARSSTSR